MPDLPSDLTAHLAGDPCRALDVYATMAGKREHFERSSKLLQERIAKVNDLGEELQSIRKTGRLVKSKLAQLGQTEHSAESTMGEQTLLPDEAAGFLTIPYVQELGRLKEEFQSTLPMFWQAEAEMDRLESQLQADAAQMQKDFKSWHSQLRKRAKKANQGGS